VTRVDRGAPIERDGCLRRAVAQYEAANADAIDEQSRSVLDRLIADKRAVDAFATFDVDENGAQRLLLACIETDELVRNFHRMVADEKHILSRLEHLDHCISDLRSFVDDTEAGPRDRLSAMIQHHADTIPHIRNSLHVLHDDIAARRRIALESHARFGATRKSRDGAETAAVGWLAEGVRRICGKPHSKAAADLAEALLGCEVSEERLREAERTRRSRNWQLPLGLHP